MRRLLSTCVLIGAVTLGFGGHTSRAQVPTFNFDTGNALFEVVGPALVPVLLQTIAPNDAPLILRHVVQLCWQPETRRL